MAYIETYTLARDPQLTQRLVGAVAQQCTNVWTENPQTAYAFIMQAKGLITV